MAMFIKIFFILLFVKEHRLAHFYKDTLLPITSEIFKLFKDYTALHPSICQSLIFFIFNTHFK